MKVHWNSSDFLENLKTKLFSVFPKKSLHGKVWQVSTNQIFCFVKNKNKFINWPMLWDQFIIDKYFWRYKEKKGIQHLQEGFFCFSTTYATHNPLPGLNVSLLSCYAPLRKACSLFLILFIQRSFELKTEDSAVHFFPTLCLTKQ